LAEVFAQRRAIVHEERVMDDVLAAHAGSALVTPSDGGTGLV
jgi:hypothetical protein